MRARPWSPVVGRKRYCCLPTARLHTWGEYEIGADCSLSKSIQGNEAECERMEREPVRPELRFRWRQGFGSRSAQASRASSFLVTTEVAQSGIRGTRFKVSTKAGFTELAVLEGRVNFLDGTDEVSPVETARKAGAKTGESAEVVEMTEVEKAEIAKVLELSKVSSTSIDTSRLASTVDGYAQKRNYFVKSAKNMEMIWCPPSGFLMGPGPEEDSPAHPVLLTKGFYLGKYEVTQEQFEKVLRVNASTFKGDDLPVEMVSWNDAVKFCDTLNKMERPPRGWKFSLPTEAQGICCRAGTTTAYSFGEFIAPESANYAASGIRRTKPVGSYPPNLFGFYDMEMSMNGRRTFTGLIRRSENRSKGPKTVPRWLRVVDRGMQRKITSGHPAGSNIRLI